MADLGGGIHSGGLPDYSVEPVKIPNLLGMAHEYAATQNELNTGYMNRQVIMARQAMGKILQESIGPDGQPDYEKAGVLMSLNPATGWMAPEFIHQMAVNKGLNLDNVGKKLSLAYEQQAAVGRTAAQLMTYGNKVTFEQERSAIMDMVKQGTLTQPIAMQILSSMPTDGNALFQTNRDYYQRAQDATRTVEDVVGKINARDLGPKIQLTREGMISGVQPAGEMTKGVTPEFSQTPMEYRTKPGEVDPDTGRPYPAGTVLAGRQGDVLAPSGPAAGLTVPVNPATGAGGDTAAPGRGFGTAGGDGTAPDPALGRVDAAPLGPPPGVAPMAPQGPQNGLAVGGGPSAQPPSPGAVIAPQGFYGAQGKGVPAPGAEAELQSAANAEPPAAAPGPQRRVQIAPSPQTDEMRNEYVAEKKLLQNSITSGLPQLLQMKEALKAMGPGGATTGGLAGWRAKAANVLYGLGFDKDFVDTIGNGSLPLSQVLEKISATNSFQTLHQLLGGQNRATNMFVEMLHNNLPNIETHPEAAKEIYALFARMYKLQDRELDGMTKWEGMGKPPEDFISQGWIPWVNSPNGQRWMNHLMTTTPEILQPEASRVQGAP